jgi:membrane protein YqaA with SNARE-associated domain
MRGFGRRLRDIALALGAPGLFLIAFLDSSFLSLPELTDLLVIWMVARHHARMPVYVFSAVAGSIAGSLVMYYIGRKGGEALVRRHFAPARIERAAAAIRRHGMMAVLIPSILPPPMPFKVFVLLAGGAGISAGRFLVAILIGRTARYLVLGILAVEYGDRAMTYLVEHGTEASLVVVGLLGAAFAAYLIWTKARTARNR